MMKPIQPRTWFSKRSLSSNNKGNFFLDIFSDIKWDKKNLLKVWWIVGWVIVLIASIWLYANVFRDLPDVSTIKNMVFSQATIITDRNGEELYKLFDQNREYIPYEAISPTMINAIVAVEDQRYWEHNWLDAMGILRAAIKTSAGSVQWASTIPQQLVMNLLLYRGKTFSEKVTRKLKEIVLTSRLDSVLEEQIRKENKGLNSKELRQKMKELTLELYLNYIFLWNNAYGIEAASRTYFGTSAINLDVLQSAIIASIPKWPSIYEPYRGRDRLMGKVTISDWQGNSLQISTWLQTEVYRQLSAAIQNAKISNGDSSTDVLRSLESVWSFRLSYEWATFQVSYTPWRKDLALSRMLQDKYISVDEFKNAVITWLTLTFQTNAFAIKAPHFVHRITELLEEEYDDETIQKWWLIVKTSLDLKTQEEAEKIFKDTKWDLTSLGANNKAMLYVDSTNGDVLAYVWSLDYFDDSIEGKNDIIRRKRQIWSSIKPLIYALWFQEIPLTTDTPIFDIPFNVWGDEPNNADGEFLGMLPLRQALSFSRNIPAIKMFLALWWEAVAKPWLKSMWLESLSDSIEYGYPMALWAGEVTMLEMADAYMQLSRQGERTTINPILEIRASDGSLLYEKEVEKKESVLQPSAASLIRDILSNTANMPSWWVNMFSVRNLKLAIKSWTSNVQTDRGNRPRDGWLATYTPSRVALFWAGNADGTPMNRNAFGGTILAGNMRAFYSRLRDNNLIVNESLTPIETIDMQVSKLTGLPVWDNTPSDFVVSTKASVYTQPSTVDFWATPIEIDTVCNGLVSPYTPMSDIKNAYVIQPYSFMPNKMDLDDIRIRWRRSTQTDTWWISDIPASQRERVLWTKYNFDNIFIVTPTEACEDRIPKEDQRIQVGIVIPESGGTIARKSTVTYSVQSPKLIRDVTVFVDDVMVGKNSYSPAKTDIVDTVTFDLPSSIAAGEIVIKVLASDIVGFSNIATQTMTLSNTDSTPPIIDSRRNIPNTDGTIDVRLFIVDKQSYVVSGNVRNNGTVVAPINGSIVSFTAEAGATYTVTAIDVYGNKLEQSFIASQ